MFASLERSDYAEGRVAQIKKGCSQVRVGLGIHYLKRVTWFPTCSVAKAARPMRCFGLKLFWGRITKVLLRLLSRWNSHAETCSAAVLWCLLQSRAVPDGSKVQQQ